MQKVAAKNLKTTQEYVTKLKYIILFTELSKLNGGGQDKWLREKTSDGAKVLKLKAKVRE